MSSNLNYTIESSDLVYNTTDADGVSTQVIYNLGDMAWGEFTHLSHREGFNHPVACFLLLMLYSDHSYGSSLDHDSRSWSILLWSTATKERVINALPFRRWYRCWIISMVLLGLQFGFLRWRFTVSLIFQVLYCWTEADNLKDTSVTFGTSL